MRFTPEQLAFADAVHAFCTKECGTLAQRDAITDGGRLSNSPALLAKLSALGWLGISFPESYGGAGASFVDECLFLEQAFRGLAPITGYTTGLVAAQTYLRWGTEEQRRTIVGSLVGGGLEAIALSEPGAGSDLGGVRLRAVRDGDAFVLDGQKTWTSAAHVANHILLLARTDTSGTKHQGLTLFMMPAEVPGLEIRPIETMEAHTVNDLFLTGVRLPAETVVGDVGNAWKQLMRGLNVERLIIAAMSLGAAQRSLDDLVGYVTVREQFGRTIGGWRSGTASPTWPRAHHRSFVYDVADRIDAGEEDHLDREGAMAKLKVTEVAKHTALEAMQMMGGYGYAREYGMEGQVRRALAPPIYGGANEIQREIISKGLGL